MLRCLKTRQLVPESLVKGEPLVKCGSIYSTYACRSWIESTRCSIDRRFYPTKTFLVVRDVLAAETTFRWSTKVYRVPVSVTNTRGTVRQWSGKARVMWSRWHRSSYGYSWTSPTLQIPRCLIAGGVPATGRPVLAWITKASLENK